VWFAGWPMLGLCFDGVWCSLRTTGGVIVLLVVRFDGLLCDLMACGAVVGIVALFMVASCVIVLLVV